MMRPMRVSLAWCAQFAADVRSSSRRRADDIGKGRALVVLDRRARGRTEAAEHTVDRKQIGKRDR